MPKHVARLVLLMVAFGIAAYAAKVFFTAESFYRYGHYRGNSVAEIASDKPKLKGSDYCKDCHAENYAAWSAGVHHNVSAGKAVQCEVCHGAAGARDVRGQFEHVSTGVDHPASGKLPVPDSRKLCPICHEKMPGRPAEQKQIDVAAHAGTAQCTSCHNPHSPLKIRGIGARDASVAASAGKAGACVGCHGGNGISANPAWPNLAGQHDAYLLEALRAYRSGARENAMMAATAKALSDDDMRKVAAHFAAMKTRSVAAGTQDVSTGKAMAAACAGCHGADGISGNPAWPSLAGQQKDYIVLALKAYRDGARKHDVMAGMAKPLSDADINALATFYAQARAH